MTYVPIRRGVMLVALALAAAGLAQACPSCKAALAADSGDLVSGFFWSILFMLSMPFMVLGGMSGYFYYLVRRARGTSPTAADDPRES